MDTQMIAVYCLCDDLLRAMNQRDDKQCRMSSAEMMTAAIVAALYYGGNFALACGMLHEQGYMPHMLSAGRFSRRLHRIKPLFLTLFATLGETFKQLNEESVYVIDTFPLPACDNIRIGRSRRYQGEDYRGYIPSKKRYFYGLKLHLLTTAQAEPVEFFLTPGSCGDVSGLDYFDFDLPPKSQIIGDKAYNDYELEDVLKEADLALLPIRKDNSKRSLPPWWRYLQAHWRKAVETAGSLLERLLPKHIHAVTAQGFELKVVLFVIAFSFNRLPLQRWQLELVYLAQLPQPRRGLLCRNVALRIRQHLIADHELLDRRRAQQWRVKVGVQLPMGIRLTIGWLPMPPHRIGETGLEKIVILDQQPLQDICQAVPFSLVKLRQAAHRTPRQQQRLEGPNRPIGHHHHPGAILDHNALARIQFCCQIIDQQRRAMLGEVRGLVLVFQGGQHGHTVICPQLPMRMRIRCPHRRALVLKKLHVGDIRQRPQFIDLLGPHVDHPANLTHGHLRQRQIMPRAETDHAANTGFRLCPKKRAACHRLMWTFRQKRREIIVKDKCLLVVGIHFAAGAFIAGAKIARRVVTGTLLPRRFLHLTLPRTFRAMGRYEHPLTRQRIVASMGMLGWHKFQIHTKLLTLAQRNDLDSACSGIRRILGQRNRAENPRATAQHRRNNILFDLFGNRSLLDILFEQQLHILTDAREKM